MTPEEILLTGMAPISRAVDNYGARNLAFTQSRINDQQQRDLLDQRHQQALAILGTQFRQAEEMQKAREHAAILLERERMARDDARYKGYVDLQKQRDSETEKRARWRAMAEQGAAFGIYPKTDGEGNVSESEEEFGKRVTEVVAGGIRANQSRLSEMQSKAAELRSRLIAGATAKFKAANPQYKNMTPEQLQVDPIAKDGIEAIMSTDQATIGQINELDAAIKNTSRALDAYMQRREAIPAIAMIQRQEDEARKQREEADRAAADAIFGNGAGGGAAKPAPAPATPAQTSTSAPRPRQVNQALEALIPRDGLIDDDTAFKIAAVLSPDQQVAFGDRTRTATAGILGVPDIVTPHDTPGGPGVTPWTPVQGLKNMVRDTVGRPFSARESGDVLLDLLRDPSKGQQFKQAMASLPPETRDYIYRKALSELSGVPQGNQYYRDGRWQGGHGIFDVPEVAVPSMPDLTAQWE